MVGFLTGRPAVAAFLCFTTTIGFFALVYMLVFVPVPQESRDILQVMIGVVGTAWTTIVGFHYGSSAHQEARNGDMLPIPEDGSVHTTSTVKTEASKTVTTEQPPAKKDL